MHELDSFLEGQTAQGQPIEQGRFTIDASRAWELMASHSQPFSEAWVLKLVQSACAAGCQQFRVAQFPSTTTFTFEGANWDWPALQAALGRVGAAGNDPLDHLAMALLWLGKSVNHPFTLSLPDNHLIRWNQSTFAVEPAPNGVAASPWLCVEHATAEQKASLWSKLVRPGVSFSSGIARILEKRAYSSAVPVYLDNRDVGGLHQDSRLAGRQSSRPLLLVTAPAGPELPEFSMRLLGKFVCDAAPKIEFTGSLPLPLADQAVGLVTLFAAYVKQAKVARGYVNTHRNQNRMVPRDGSSFLLWNLDGVIICEEELALQTPIGFGVVVNAAGLTTDLSGFGLVEDQPFKNRRLAALRGVRMQLDDLVEQRKLTVDVQRQGDFLMKTQIVATAITLVGLFPVGLVLGANTYKAYCEEAELEKTMEQTYMHGLSRLRYLLAELLSREAA